MSDPVGQCTLEEFDALVASLGVGSEASATGICTTFATASATSATINQSAAAVNTLFLVSSGALVFVMHAGFAMLCAGAIRHKNTMNILLQTVLDAAVSALAFYICGYAFAYGQGKNPNGFIGDGRFALNNFATSSAPSGTGTWQDFFFQWAFAATATTIPAGCVAERFNFNAYLGYSIFISAFVYPVVVHWQWSAYGWLGYARLNGLYHLFGSGMIDYAGSSVVHMVGGLSGLMGCIMVGPRLGRFDSSGKPVTMPGHSPTLTVLGTLLLWFGWYGFNPGSQLLVDLPGSQYEVVVARAAVTTTLGAAAGAVSALALTFIRHKAWDVISLCNGALVGLVAVTAGANVLEPWAAILDGMISAWIFELVCILFLKLRIDDPLSAAPMHGFCGAWGIFFVGLLAKEEYVIQAYAGSHDSYGFYPYGLFYPGGGGRLLASQVIGILTITTWVCGLMGIFFYIFKLCNCIRISANEEYAGLDVSKHGGSAYVVFQDGHVGQQAVAVQLDHSKIDPGVQGAGPFNGEDQPTTNSAVKAAAQ